MTDNFQLILDTVKQKPLYSVDKLRQVLPQFSRHYIQKFLEENQLSTTAKRLAFADKLPPEPVTQSSEVENLLPASGSVSEPQSIAETPVPDQVLPPSSPTEPLPASSPPVNQSRLKKLAQRLSKFKLPKPAFNFLPRFPRRPAPVYILLAIFLVCLGWGIRFFKVQNPEIRLDRPDVNYTQKGDNLFVAGQVVPGSSKVTVNGSEVSLNGDGTFTAVVTVPMGESVLRVEAFRWHKSSQLLRLVKREPTEEENLALQEKETERKLAAANKAAEVDRKVTDLMAAREATVLGASQGFLKIINNEVEENEGFFSIVGEVVNYGDEPAGWVMITARFLDPKGNLLDTKYGFATEFEETIKPGESSKFETQPTQEQFEQYQLEISWDENLMTEATVSGLPEESSEATASATED